MYEGFLLGKVRSGIRLDPDLHLVRSLPWRPLSYSSHLIQKFFKTAGIQNIKLGLGQYIFVDKVLKLL